MTNLSDVAKWRPRSETDPQWARAVNAFTRRVATTPSEHLSDWEEWPEFRALQRLMSKGDSE